jgi:hypothetical protein
MSRLRTLIALGLVIAFSSHLSPAAPAGALEHGSYRDHHQVVTVNIQVGRNASDPADSSAYRHFNQRITRLNSTNTVQSRMIARSEYLHGIALQEVCEANLNNIVWQLTVGGHMSGTLGFRYRQKTTIHDAPSTDLSSGCGNWFGNATLVRGRLVGEGTGFFNDQSGERRGWLCVRSYLVLCNTHLTTGHKVADQLNEYRSIANWNAGSAAPSVSAFAAGDFNVRPSDLSGWWAAAWAFDGWLDADHSDYQPTNDGGTTLDYLWRTNPNAWAYDAFVSPWSHTDHHWKQGYT